MKIQDSVDSLDNPKYTQSCCGAHVTVGTQIICFLNILFVGFIAIYHLTTINSTPFAITFVVTVCIFTYIIYGLGFYGVQKEKPKLLIPLIIIMAIHLFLSIADSGYTFYTFLTSGTPNMLTISYFSRNLPYRGNPNDHFSAVLTTLTIRAIFYFVLNFWFFVVVLRCYQFLDRKVKDEFLPKHLQTNV